MGIIMIVFAIIYAGSDNADDLVSFGFTTVGVVMIVVGGVALIAVYVLVTRPECALLPLSLSSLSLLCTSLTARPVCCFSQLTKELETVDGSGSDECVFVSDADRLHDFGFHPDC